MTEGAEHRWVVSHTPTGAVIYCGDCFYRPHGLRGDNTECPAKEIPQLKAQLARYKKLVEDSAKLADEAIRHLNAVLREAEKRTAIQRPEPWYRKFFK